MAKPFITEHTDGIRRITWARPNHRKAHALTYTRKACCGTFLGYGALHIDMCREGDAPLNPCTRCQTITKEN